MNGFYFKVINISFMQMITTQAMDRCNDIASRFFLPNISPVLNKKLFNLLQEYIGPLLITLHAHGDTRVFGIKFDY